MLPDPREGLKICKGHYIKYIWVYMYICMGIYRYWFMTQSAQQAQSKKNDTYILKSWRQSNAPILITIMALWLYLGYGSQWRSSRIVSVRTNRVFNKCKTRSIIFILISMRRMGALDCLHYFVCVAYVLNLWKNFFGGRRLL